MVAVPSYTGRARRRKTHWSVKAAELLAQILISIGGIGTILAVATVCVFLVFVVVPLFRSAYVHQPVDYSQPWLAERPLLSSINEYRRLGWSLFPDGRVAVYRLDNGQLIKVWKPAKLYQDAALTACSAPSRNEETALGFADGTVQFARLGFAVSDLKPKQISATMRSGPVGEYIDYVGKGEDDEPEAGLLFKTSEGRFILHKAKLAFDPPVKAMEAAAIERIDLSVRAGHTVVSYLTASGNLYTSSVSQRENLETGEIVKELSGGKLAVRRREGKELPRWLMVTGVGDNVWLIWPDGALLRVSTRNLEEPAVMEEVALVDQPGVQVTAVQLQIGKATMLVGDSTGRIRAWFRVNSELAQAKDRSMLVAAHDFPGPGAAVTALAVSSRTRMMAAGYADGLVRLLYVTSEKQLAEVWTKKGQPVEQVLLAPKDDGLVARGGGAMWLWQVDPRHPEITLTALYRPIWYEGYERPAHVWQSTGGDDAVEPKFGLWPLIFGTLKATLYSLLIGVPLALLAAVYTSEFLHPRSKAVVKPVIETMASLPSVVLGFLAALVLAPFVENALAAVLACFLSVPLTFLAGAYVFQVLPGKLALRLERFRFLFAALALPAGIGLAAWVGPLLEHLMFASNFRGWLDGQIKTAVPGWFFLLIPLCGLATVYLLGQVINPLIRRWTAGWGRLAAGAADLGKFLAALGFTLALAWALAVVLAGYGFDPRGGPVGTYVQRNALVVGFMMGFAIIPIIYTIAEDALSVVPEHLRSASLGCGATPWQTAMRIIIPTAMSGLFSAVMIGLGRAVGETMIVLMAGGNTPVEEWNVFNGFRTLSANIAVELPEAVKDSTHFRTLFLAALNLFVLTFALNTVAEMVRLRFRRRAYQL